MKTLVYFRNLLSDKYVASVAPSSRFAIERILSKIDFTQNNVIIEFGPGTGNFTLDILKQMTKSSKLIAIERNRNFYGMLKRELKDQRMMLFNECAGNLNRILGYNGHGCVDYIVSGIPFSLISDELKQTILNSTHVALKKGGKFLSYQTFYQPAGHLRNHLKRLYATVCTEYVLRCLPPLSICEAVK